MPKVEFAEFTAEEKTAVSKIINRAANLIRQQGDRFTRDDRRSLEMDLSATHAVSPSGWLSWRRWTTSPSPTMCSAL